MGLCFSVPDGMKVPPSLVNIFKNLQSTITGFKIPKNGNLTKWAV
jgi:uracil-DNA glycosylase